MRRLLFALALLPSLAGATDITINGTTYTLPAHPRVLLDGPSGTITARLKDPDGAGAGVAPQATDANPAYVALKSAVRSCRAAPNYCVGDEGVPQLLALDWYMDNSQTASLAAAIYQLNHAETLMVGGPGGTDILYGFGCSLNATYCGVSSFLDWPSQAVSFWALAYSLVRSEMSAGERTAFAQKMFNDDLKGYESDCTNQLQPVPTVTLTYTQGSTSGTGTNLNLLTPGRLINIFTAAANVSWANIATIPDSTHITFTDYPRQALGNQAGSMTNATVLELLPWDSDTCGLTWHAQHHPWSPRGPTNSFTQKTFSAYTIGATSITVANTAGFPATPFYVSNSWSGEVMLVTNVAGNVLTVTRAQMGTNAVAVPFPDSKFIYYSRYIPYIGGIDYSDNKQIQHLLGYVMMGIALADDSAIAEDYAEKGMQLWIDIFLPQIRDMWTGFQQGGSTNYGPGRVLSHNFQMMLTIKSATGLDYKGTHLTQHTAESFIYGTQPDSGFMPWGQPDIANASDYHAHIWAPMYACLAGGSDSKVALWNDYQRDKAYYTAAGLVSGATERFLPYALICFQESDARGDTSALPTAKVFNQVDGTANRAISAMISRTGWASTSDTLVDLASYSQVFGTFNMGTGSAGNYRIYKAGYLMTENGNRDTGSGTNNNGLLFGGVAGVLAGKITVLDRSELATEYAFARVNAVAAYAPAVGVTRAIRHLIHFKKAASPDYVVVYDTAATSSAKTISQNLFYDKTADQASTMTDQTMPSFVWTGSNRRLSTAVVLPSGTGAAATYTNLTDAHREAVCASSDGSTCASVTSAEFLIVHKPSTSVSDTMPTVAALATIDADFSGVQIEDATAPSVAVFAKAGADQTSGSFTSTHSGTAQYVVTGLVAGTYDVVRGGATTVLDDEVVGTDGTLAFESTAGAFTITEGTAPPPSITITTTSLPNHVEDVAGYSQTLAYTGGTGSVTWSVTAGSLCAGLTLTGATGEIAGTPTTQQTCSFTVTATDSASPTPQTDTQDLSITITAAPPACVITTTTLPNGTRQVAYSQVLASSGCTAPLSWTITSGTICTGLTLTEATGAISGTPTVVQSCPITVRLADSAAGVDTEALSITIDAPAPAVLNITTTSPLPSCVQHQPCSTTFQATGGTPPYTWTKASGTYCVGNDSLSGATLSGVPTTIETCSFTMQVEDDDSATDTQAFQRSIVNPSPSLTVQTIVGSQAVIVKFSTPAMDGSELCNVTVTDEELDDTTGLPIGPVGSAVSSQGRSTRVVTVGGLTAEHRHSVSVVCGSVASGSALFTTPAAVGGTISWKYVAVPSARLQAQSAAKLKVYYALPGEAEASSTNASCGSGCTVTLSLTSGAIYNIRHQWLTSGDAVLATTQTSPVVVP